MVSQRAIAYRAREAKKQEEEKMVKLKLTPDDVSSKVFRYLKPVWNP